MNIPKFYIYGVPEGFNILSGTPEDILYYQLFYNTGKKGTEFVINRKADGETVYSYLKYNLVSCGGREGAFFGMSIVFSNYEYCNAPTTLRDLFGAVYQQVILKAEDKDKIVVETNGNVSSGRFCVSKFEQRKDKCDAIGRIIINNITTKFAENIISQDASFSNSKEGRVLTLPFEANAQSINDALHNYSWVALSSEFKIAKVPHVPGRKHDSRDLPSEGNVTGGVDLLSYQYIKELTDKESTYKDFIIRALKGQASAAELSTYREKVNHDLDTLEEFVGRQPELIPLKDKYYAIYQDIREINKSQPIKGDDIGKEKGDEPNKGKQSNGGEKTSRKNNMDVIKQHMPKIVAAATVLMLVILAAFLYPSVKSAFSPPQPGPQPIANDTISGPKEQPFNEDSFNELLSKHEFEDAWKMLEQLEDKDKKTNLTYNLQNAYYTWFNNEYNNNQKDQAGLNQLLEKIQKYKAFIDQSQIETERNLLNTAIDALKPKAAPVKATQSSAEQTTEINGNGSKRKDNTGSNTSGNDSDKANSKASQVEIYNADIDYNKTGDALQQTSIKCKVGERFVVTGVNKFQLSSNNVGVTQDRDKSELRIQAERGGSVTVTINNQKTYTFNITLVIQ